MFAARTHDADRVRRQRWLDGAGAVARGERALAQRAGVLDAAGAIAFAAGLAWAIASLARGGPAWPGAALMAAAGTVRGGLAWASGDAAARAAARIKIETRSRAMRAALNAAPDHRPPVGETVARLVDGVEALDGYFSRFAPARAAATLAPLVIILAIAGVSPISAALMIVAFAPFLLAMILAGGAAAEEARRQVRALDRLSGLFGDRVRALPVVLAFQAESRTAARIGEAAGELAGRSLSVLRVAFVSSAALELFSALSVALVAVYCGFGLLGLLPIHAPWAPSLGRAVFVLALAPEAYLPLRRLAAAYHERQLAEAAADGLIEAEAAGEREAGRRDLIAPPAIVFRGVRVVYPGRDRPALDGFDLTIRPGEMVALVGSSGCGKSTVLNLLLGLAPAEVGRVMIDGADLGAGVAAAWAGQNPVVAPASLRDNIALAQRQASAEAVAQAARLAGLSATPDALERRIDERGGGLSGGERTRLGLARAMLHGGPLLLLDEPTAGLDAASEQALLPILARAARGRTCLIATHSPAVAALADRVVVLAS